jgi:hypothetical protein
MAICHRCGFETQLCSNGIPICLACADAADVKSKPAQNDAQLRQARTPLTHSTVVTFSTFLIPRS